MRYGYWLPVFGGWLRNVPDEGMSATWKYVKKLAQRSEQIGYDITLIAELFMNDIKGIDADSLEAWSTAAALAAVTEKLELMVAVRPTFHEPAIFAKQAANIGGSGAGITRFDDARSLAAAATAGTIDLGVDHVALVQELAPLRDAHITRVEVLDGNFLYAINVYPAEDSFNLCPADVCQTTDGQQLSRTACAVDAPRNGMRVEQFTPPQEIVREVELIARHVELDVGGIEYLVDDRDGQHYFYDINALSNFVADPQNVVGFDPFERLVDYLVSRTRILAPAGFGQ